MSPDTKAKRLAGLSVTGRFSKVTFADLRAAEKIFASIWALEDEVNNGGFHQYFFNSSGDTAFFVVEALEKIGATRAARIVRAANAVFPGGIPPSDQSARQCLLDSLDDDQRARLERLDDEFYAYPDDLTALLFAFVETNAREIDGAADLFR